MDFLNRNSNNQSQAARPSSNSQGPSSVAAVKNEGYKIGRDEPQWLRVIFVVLLFSVTILAIAIAISLYFGKDREAGYIDEQKQQAVFLTNGQVYFGTVAAVTDNYIDLQGIYYLNSQQQPESAKKDSTQTSFSLVKLGCELHGPADQMIINRDQVSFWENLKADGKVAKAIEEFKSKNPNGQTCSESTGTTNQSTTTPTTDTTKKQ